MTSLVTEKGNKDECLANAGIVKALAKKFGTGKWSLLVHIPKSGILWKVHKEPGIILWKKCSWNSQKADILPSVQQLHCPGVSLRANDMDPIDTIFRIIRSVNQLSVYGAVAAFCEEFENHQDGSV